MAVSGTTSGPELLVELDRGRRAPLHSQLADGLRDAIRTGRLAPHARLPSSRVLAADLGVSRRLVVDAYSQLVAEGFLLSRQGSGTFGPPPSTPRADHHTTGRIRFCATTSTSPLARPTSAASRDMPGYGRCGRPCRDSVGHLRHVAPQGVAATRAAVAEYLRRTRGVVADPDHVVLCSGVTQAIALLAVVLHDGALPLAMEDPGSGYIEWCWATTVSTPSPCQSTAMAWTSLRWPPAARQQCWRPRRISRRRAWC